MKNPRRDLPVDVYCTGKDKLTATLARAIAKRSRHAGNNPYKCTNCGHWHVGSHLVKSVRRPT